MTSTANASTDGDWVALGQADEIVEDQGKAFTLAKESGELSIAIFHHQGEWYALEDCCSHARIPIVDGPVKDGCVMCPWHYAEFDLKTGAALSGPATEGLKTYPVRLTESGAIEVQV